MILHVEELPTPYAGGEMLLPQPEYPNPEIRRMLEAVVPADPNVKFEHHLVLGTPADDIVRLADEQKVDLIVIGTHGRTGLKRVLMGSVAEAVMRAGQLSGADAQAIRQVAADKLIETRPNPLTRIAPRGVAR